MEINFAGLLPEALLVDFPEIDAQHEEIFHRIESLKTACFEISYVPIAEFDALFEYFAMHFATEERIAEEAGLEFAEHTKIHEDTLRMLRRALAEVRSKARDAHSFLRYCEYWFERHIAEDDRLFISILQSGAFNRSSSLRHAGRPRFSSQA
jgi:hemerythrin-like metal-binding protein